MHNGATNPISPIRVSPNGRYFVDPAGHPAFWLGDAQWELFRLFTPEGRSAFCGIGRPRGSV